MASLSSAPSPSAASWRYTLHAAARSAAADWPPVAAFVVTQRRSTVGRLNRSATWKIDQAPNSTRDDDLRASQRIAAESKKLSNAPMPSMPSTSAKKPAMSSSFESRGGENAGRRRCFSVAASSARFNLPTDVLCSSDQHHLTGTMNAGRCSKAKSRRSSCIVTRAGLRSTTAVTTSSPRIVRHPEVAASTTSGAASRPRPPRRARPKPPRLISSLIRPRETGSRRRQNTPSLPFGNQSPWKACSLGSGPRNHS